MGGWKPHEFGAGEVRLGNLRGRALDDRAFPKIKLTQQLLVSFRSRASLSDTTRAVHILPGLKSVVEPSSAQHIAVLIESLEEGGAQRRVVALANGFAAAARRVDLIVTRAGSELADEVSPKVRLVRLDGDGAQLNEYLVRDAPDLLLAGAASIHDMAVAALPLPRPFPLVLRASSHPFRSFPWSMPRQRLREIARRRRRLRNYRAADLIIAVAEDVAAAVRQAVPGACVIVSNDPVITPRFLAGADAPVPLPWRDDEHVPLVLGVGRLALAKDFPTLLRAFALLRRTRPARLVILGPGSSRDRRRLARLAAKLGIGDDFAQPGPSDIVAAWLKRADLFVCSSLWEGVPGALIEAMAMGCRVVSTSSVGSAGDLLRSGELGSIVAPSKPDAMARAMAAELDRQVDRAALIAAAEPYREGRQAEKYLAVMDQCVREFSARPQGR